QPSKQPVANSQQPVVPIPPAGYRPYWLLATGYWLLAIGYWLGKAFSRLSTTQPPQYDGGVMIKPAAVVTSLAALVLSLPLPAQAPTFTIQADHPTAAVSPTLYGLMTEEINYSYDGGIYGELVRDRAIGRGFGSLTHW